MRTRHLVATLAILFAFATTLSVGPPHKAYSQGGTGAVDQSNITRASGALNVGCYAPVGQSFTSSGGKLAGVTLALLVYRGPAEITVLIRQGSIGGPVVASSTLTLLPGDEPSRFEYFPLQQVDLAPGAVYVIHPVTACVPEILWHRTGTGLNDPDAYPAGTAFVNGEPSGRTDFIFQTCLEMPGRRCLHSGQHLWPDVVPPPLHLGRPPCTPPYDMPDDRCPPGGPQ